MAIVYFYGMLNKEERIQYKRHLTLDQIGVEGQNKLKEAKVLVVGAGGLGCPVLQYLAAAGVGTLGIIDHDTVDQTNLQRQILYTHHDIGKPKVDCAIGKLQALNPFITFKGYAERLHEENILEIFKLYDIIVDGTDNFSTRYLINDAAVLSHKPVVFGSIFKFEGQVSVYNFKNGPTYRCLFPKPSTAALNCEEAGVLGVLPGIIGTMQANEVLKIICGIGEVLSGKLLIFDALSMTQHILKFEKTEQAQINQIQPILEQCVHASYIEDMTFDSYELEKENLFVLDVRTDIEREQFCLESYHIPLAELEQRVSEIQTKKPILVYCQSGKRSAQAIQILKSKQLPNTLYNLKGGLLHANI